MNGILHENLWYENTGFQCRRCGGPVYKSDLPKYVYQCFTCDEDFYSFEVEPQGNRLPPHVIVARRVDGITLNTDLELLLGDSGQPIIFADQSEAEAFLLEHGVDAEEMAHMYFVEVPEDTENFIESILVTPPGDK